MLLVDECSFCIAAARTPLNYFICCREASDSGRSSQHIYSSLNLQFFFFKGRGNLLIRSKHLFDFKIPSYSAAPVTQSPTENTGSSSLMPSFINNYPSLNGGTRCFTFPQKSQTSTMFMCRTVRRDFKSESTQEVVVHVTSPLNWSRATKQVGENDPLECVSSQKNRQMI